MDNQERFDRAIGDPDVRVDVAGAIERATRERRRIRAATAGSVAAVAAVVGGGLWWGTGINDDLPIAETRTVQVNTCTDKQMKSGTFTAESDGVPFLVTGARGLCLKPGTKVLDRTDNPVPGFTSVALQLDSGASAKGNPERFNLSVVFGPYGLDPTYGLPQFDADWSNPKLLSGDRMPEVRPLEDYVAELRTESFADSPQRTQGWRHCADRPAAGDGGEHAPAVWVKDGQVCVAQGYEVLSRRSGGDLVTDVKEWALQFTPAGPSPADARKFEEHAELLADVTLWEVLNENGELVYDSTKVGREGPLTSSFPTPFRLPFGFAAGVLMTTPSSGEVSEEAVEVPGESATDGPSASASIVEGP